MAVTFVEKFCPTIKNSALQFWRLIAASLSSWPVRHSNAVQEPASLLERPAV